MLACEAFYQKDLIKRFKRNQSIIKSISAKDTTFSKES